MIPIPSREALDALTAQHPGGGVVILHARHPEDSWSWRLYRSDDDGDWCTPDHRHILDLDWLTPATPAYLIHPQPTVCAAESERGLLCTRPVGHDGVHVAHGEQHGHHTLLDAWPTPSGGAA